MADNARAHSELPQCSLCVFKWDVSAIPRNYFVVDLLPPEKQCSVQKEWDKDRAILLAWSPRVQQGNGWCSGETEVEWGRQLKFTTPVELGRELVWWGGNGGREWTLDSLRNLEVPSGVRGPKDRAQQPLTQIPLLANIAVLQIYGLLRNNNCQRAEARITSFPLRSGD